MRKIIYSAVVVIFLFACTKKSDSKDSGNLKTNEAVAMEKQKTGTVMQIVKIKSDLSDEEFFIIAKEREPEFRAIPGIIQKYYIRLGKPGEYGGVYIWDSAESMEEFKKSELAATIPKAYKVIETPSIEIVDILFQLRE